MQGGGLKDLVYVASNSKVGITKQKTGWEEEDNYAYEEEQEKLTEMKTIHQPMRKWYFNHLNDLQSKFGGYPSMWQELSKWEHYYIVKKIYFKHSDRDLEGSVVPLIEDIEESLKKKQREEEEEKEKNLINTESK